MTTQTYAASALVRAWIAEQIEALVGTPAAPLPPLGTPEWLAADEDTQRAAALAAAAATYEDADDTADRLRREVSNLRAWYLADQAAQIDALQAAVRDDRRDLARLPTFEELKARRHMHPPATPIAPPAPGWPAVVIPGSGGKRQAHDQNGAAA